MISSFGDERMGEMYFRGIEKLGDSIFARRKWRKVCSTRLGGVSIEDELLKETKLTSLHW